MTDQHQHRATDEEWALTEARAAAGHSFASSCIVELRNRIQLLEATQHVHVEVEARAVAERAAAVSDLHSFLAAVRAQSKTVAHLSNRVEKLEELHAAVVDLNQRFNLDPLVDRIELLEATQHAHIEALAMAERAAAVSDHAKQGWNDRVFAKTETTYGSDTTIPELSEHYAPVEPEQQDKLDRLIEFGIGAQVGRSSAADTRRMLALQDQIRDGELTLAEALKEINGKTEPAADAQLLTLVERMAEAIEVEDAPIPEHGHEWTPEARAAIRVVAEWLEENPGPNSAWTAVARDLMDEANR